MTNSHMKPFYVEDNDAGLTAAAMMAGADKIAHSIDNVADSIADVAESIQCGSKRLALSNYEIAKSILKSSTNVLTGLTSISEEMERKNKLDEYYHLISEITKIEDELYKMGVLKEAYERLELPKTSIIEMNEQELKFCACIFGKKLEHIKNIIFNMHLSPLKFLETQLHSVEYFQIKIFSIFKWMQEYSKPPYRNVMKAMQLDLGIELPVDYLNVTTVKQKSGFFTLECNINEHSYPVYYYEDESDVFYEQDLWEHNIQRVCDKNFEEVLTKVATKFPTVYETIENDMLICAYLDNTFISMVMQISSEDLGYILENVKKDLESDYSPQLMSKMSELQVLLNDVNRDIALQNLRLLYEQLRLILRQFKFDSLMNS